MANNIHDLFKRLLSDEKKEFTSPYKGALQPINPVIELLSSISESQPANILRKKDGKERALIGDNPCLDKPIKTGLPNTLDSPFFKDKIPHDLPKLVGQLNSPQAIQLEQIDEIALPPPIVFVEVIHTKLSGSYPTLTTDISSALSEEDLSALSSQFDNSPLDPECGAGEAIPSQSDLNLSNQIPNGQVVPPLNDRLIYEVDAGRAPQLVRCQVITRIALGVIAMLCLAATLVGVFATIGLHVPGAPQFMVTIAKGLTWNFTAYILTAAGPTYLFGLGIYVLVERRRREALIYRG